jgi:hypothetical protein
MEGSSEAPWISPGLILLGDMKDLMNKVAVAGKAAQANLIACREGRATMGDQANRREYASVTLPFAEKSP